MRGYLMLFAAALTMFVTVDIANAGGFGGGFSSRSVIVNRGGFGAGCDRGFGGGRQVIIDRGGFSRGGFGGRGVFIDRGFSRGGFGGFNRGFSRSRFRFSF